MVPSADSLARWEGVLFVYDGPYGGSVLRFSILFEHDFPKAPPRIRFGTNIYHRAFTPCVSHKSHGLTYSDGGSKD